MEPVTFRIAADPPSRLDKALARDVPEAAALSRSRIARLLEAGAVRVNGAVALDAKARVAEGDAVEIATYRKGFQIAYLAGEEEESKYIPPMRGHYYEVVLFQGWAPIIEKTYTLTTPRTMPVQFEVYNGEVASSQTYDDQNFTFVFRKQDVPAAEHEWSIPDLSEYAPKVEMATVQERH